MIILGILIAHLFGDYVLQNDWIAAEKTKQWSVAVLHGVLYALAYVLMFLIVGVHRSLPVLLVLLVIGGTHIVIDRLRLAKQLIWALNQLAPPQYRYSWRDAKKNAGYSSSKPAWMSTWLMIIVDNTVHLTINGLAIAVLLR